ncbi:MAG: deoxynucleoside kinase [Bacteroidia bacterium]|nr:deoxynucleoside kinase [Bacteroidia bacterium]MDW8159052.1 deoxynucleoside kinase [Bacteroidia bacterium]
MYHIAIAGNIGSGKTSLATLLAKHLGYEVHYEEPTNNPYIYDFYSDMQRWSFNMQIYFLNTRLQHTLMIQRSNKNYVQDRTIYEDAEIFAPNLLAMGLMLQRDYDTYKSLFNTVIQLISPPTLVIYLKGSIAVLVDQISARGREYEDSIRIDYLKKLNERYDHWFENYNMGKKLEINIDELRFRENPEHMGIILQRVTAELYGLFSQSNEL